ncbi:MAG TPA: hypothetical protein VGL20_08490 [Candidatus Dormibacteraeota bacterium]|jgi:hypothetical protein
MAVSADRFEELVATALRGELTALELAFVMPHEVVSLGVATAAACDGVATASTLIRSWERLADQGYPPELLSMAVEPLDMALRDGHLGRETPLLLRRLRIFAPRDEVLE